MSLDPARAARLRKTFEAACSGQQKLTSRTHRLFLEAICADPVPAATLHTLATSPNGIQSVKDAIWSDISPIFCNGLPSDLIEYFSTSDLAIVAGGELLRRVLLAIVDPPIFWTAFVQAHKTGQLTPKAERSFAVLLLRLLQLLPEDRVGPFRELAQVPAIINPLLQSSHADIPDLAANIKALSETHVVRTSVRADCSPGGRHDNDMVDFRAIAILPTADELASKKAPFIRTSDYLDDESTESTRTVDHLDNQFRLLREDFLYEMREELAFMKNSKRKTTRQTVVDELVLHSIHYEPFQNPQESRGPKRVSWGISLRCKQDLPQMRGLEDVDKRKAWFTDKKNRTFLKHQAVVLLLADGNELVLGALHRDEDMLASSPPILIVQLTGEASIVGALPRLKSAKSIKLIVLDAALFAYEPVLKALQQMNKVPLDEDTLFWEPGVSPSMSSTTASQLVSALQRNPSCDLQPYLKTSSSIRLDQSQSDSLLSGLTQTVSLIQGPPGTGKSFLGALLGKALYDFTPETILVVCYTNHALDDYLEALLNIGIPASSMVRLGGKSTPKTESLLLRNQTRSSRGRGGADWEMIDGIKEELNKRNAELRMASVNFMSATSGFQLILNYLEFEDPEFFYAFDVPTSTDGMQTVGRGNKAVGPDYLIQQWSSGKDAGVFRTAENVLETAAVWQMPRSSRDVKMSEWRTNAMKDQLDSIYDLTRRYNACVSQLDAKFSEGRFDVLSTKRVIGCTTTAAAMYRDAILAASPGVLLVEEAGEILESHVLTSMAPQTKQLILIGDHKQLRPKVNHYQLTVEKGDGYNLNRSLFERLVLKGYPHTTLKQQHRMRPEISSLVRTLMYPELLDAERTQGRPNLRGVRDNVIFIQHEHPEGDLSELRQVRGESQDSGRKASKQNLHEVQMVLQILRYIGQQGYGTEHVVLLTPYLGQLRALQLALRETNDPVLSDLDNAELIKAGINNSAALRTSKKQIRLATIDNYQGEESDIVIASLTRSNPAGDIGFMAAEERINVLLSRARNAMILIGNANTFQNAKKGKSAWKVLFDSLREKGHFYDGLPVKCERHPDRVALLRSPQDFNSFAPDGGCSEPCGVKLACGHECPSKCHRITDHTQMTCEYAFYDKCSNGHPLRWKCHSGRPLSCQTCDKEVKALAKKLEAEFELKEKRRLEEEAHVEKMAEIQAQLAKEQESAKDLRLAEERRAALLQKEKDLKDAAARNMHTQASAAANSTAPASNPFVSSSGSQYVQGDRNTLNSSSSAPTASAPAASTGPATTATTPSSSKTPSSPRPAPAPTASAPKPARQAKPSAAQADWDRQKRVEGAESDAIDALMAMTGLEQVKAKFLDIKAVVDTANRQGVALKNRYNIALLGNPGTGKTTVARHFARFLADSGILPGIAFVETTGSRLGAEGVQFAQKQIDSVLAAGGGTIFVDEAYQLKSKDSAQGSVVLDFLLAEMENNTGKICFAFAGYSKEMEQFFEHNPGLPSRVPYSLQFDDYSDEELMDMLERMLDTRYKGRMRVGDQDGIRGLYGRVAVRRLGRGRGKKGFGNARDLENRLQRILERQATRLKDERAQGRTPDDFLMVKEDIIGPNPADVLVESAEYKKLQSLIGLQTIKKTVADLFEMAKVNYERELLEKEPHLISLNRVFLGPPGTGKTTVAQLYGKILADLGMLSNGEVVLKNPADFVGAYIGHSEKQTKSILSNAVGKVLVIDEAYGLYGGKHGDTFKTAVIDTIVAEVQGTVGEDRAVLLLGYKEQMEEMFNNVNPGLQRRFSLEEAFQFVNYSDGELLQALEWKMKERDLSATDDAKATAIAVLARMRNRPNFGNIGEVETLLSKAKVRWTSRQSSLPAEERSPDAPFEAVDFDANFDRDKHAATNLAKLFEGMVGCEEVIKKLDKYQKTAKTAKARGRDPRDLVPMNFLFKGPPGTGKTTTARKMGQVYFDMGLLSSNEVIECSASDLVGEYVGQTGPKTKKVFQKALSRVLFIDEAYRLGEGRFAKEAMDELVGILTHEDFKGKLLCIMAGYDREINELLSVNTGLASRFPEELYFKNLTPEQSLDVLNRTLKENGVVVNSLESTSDTPDRRRILKTVGYLAALPSWGNSRDMITLARQMVSVAFTESTVDPDAASNDPIVLPSQAVVDCMETMLEERQKRSKVPLLPRLPKAANDAPVASGDSSGPPPAPTTSGAATSANPPPPPPPPPASVPPAQPPREPPTSRGRPAKATTATSPRSPVSPVPPTAHARRPSQPQHRTSGNPGIPPFAPPNQAQARRGPVPGSPAVSSPTSPTQGRPSAAPSADTQRDAGVSDAIWQQLQADRRAAEEARRKQEAEMRKLIEQQKRADRQKRELEAKLAALAQQAEEEARRQYEAEKRRQAALVVERARRQAAIDAQRRETERKRQEEARVQMKLRQLGVCVQGFQWIKQASGYRCAGGAHFIDNARLNI